MELNSDLDNASTTVAAVCAALKVLRGTEFSRLQEADLLTLAKGVEHAARLMFTAQVALAGEIDIRRISATHGCTSTTALLRQTLTISSSDARARVTAAKAVLPQELPSGGETGPVLPLLGAALDEGGIGAEQTRIIVATMRKLPAKLAQNTRDLAQKLLVDNGQITEPEPFAAFARGLALRCNPDGDFDDRDHAERVDLTVGPRNPVTGMTPFRGHLDDEGVELLGQAIGGLSQAAPADPDGTPDRRTAATRRGQALQEVLRRYLNLGDAPIHGGERPHITVTMSFDDLKNSVGVGTLQYGGPISAAHARMLACDANVIPAVLGSKSEVLDIGRSTRIWPAAIRRAITLRDIGCAWYCCDRPAAWCDIHHVDFWADGGSTNYQTGALFCGQHHKIIHEGHWKVRFAPDGIPEVIPPIWVDPTQAPRRNTYHHINEKLRT